MASFVHAGDKAAAPAPGDAKSKHGLKMPSLGMMDQILADPDKPGIPKGASGTVGPAPEEASEPGAEDGVTPDVPEIPHASNADENSAHDNSAPAGAEGAAAINVPPPPDKDAAGVDPYMEESLNGTAKEEEPAYDLSELLKLVRESDATTQVIYDEGFQAVEVSMKDISRLVCFSDITRTVYSKEKGLEIKSEGKDAFIKNLPVESVDPGSGKISLRYDKRPKEIYIICGGRTFSLLLIPRDIPAVTVYLKTRHSDKEKASRYEQATDHENTMFRLIKDVYHEDLPDGYEVEEVNTLVHKYIEADVIHRRTYTGDRFQVREFIIHAKTPVALDELLLLETLKVGNPVAITLVDSSLESNQQTRVIVVRLNHE